MAGHFASDATAPSHLGLRLPGALLGVWGIGGQQGSAGARWGRPVPNASWGSLCTLPGAQWGFGAGQRWMHFGQAGHILARLGWSRGQEGSDEE